MNNFDDDNKFSLDARDDPMWEKFYRTAFPDMDFMTKQTSALPAQRLGIDRWISLSSGKLLAVDEKKRRTEYNDIALEYLSNDRTNAPGWIEKETLQIDYLAYAFMQSKRCFLFPWQGLRRAWLTHKTAWMDLARRKMSGYSLHAAPNPNYHTLCIMIPTKDLANAVARSMLVQIQEAA